METFFRYNWIVREQWYTWCADLPPEELLRQRTGGAGSILKTFFHVIDVEWSWLQLLQGKPDEAEDFAHYQTLGAVRDLDRKLHLDVELFVRAWEPSMEKRAYIDRRTDGHVELAAWGEIVRHVIAHEIHHMGQLSVWARELGEEPVSANVIGKRLIQPD
ncbi:DinB family protein [Paenibacillus barcinonensis]|uniref:DinB family protein n=1 Tax=Paenibacillus barcinonensis TaxID=198119 RepID=A0A2V4WDT6_PAEBA|nr:DinB family protein [Paenibacillus barcinonensis]PYE49643.1 putative damage-inducible protein DinB [Paenibacillus barcinonensis]QKS56651.1 DinB family protein [Paenibacillus barcinonensis]